MGYPTAHRFVELAQFVDANLNGMRSPSVLELGDQTLGLTDNDLRYIGEFLGKYGRPDRVEKYAKRVGTRIWVSEVYEDAGWTYTCADLNEQNGAIPLDLNIWPNAELNERTFQKFDIVTNFGTTEHLGNQLNAYAIVHYLCRPGGLIVHHIPMLHCGNHAMVDLTPKFFHKLINFNGYEVLEAKWEGHVINQALDFHFDPALCFIKNYKDILETSTKGAMGYFVLRNEGELFVPPLDIDVTGEAERKSLTAYIGAYAHPLHKSAVNDRVEKVLAQKPTTAALAATQETSTRYGGRRGYLAEELDESLSVRVRKDANHLFRVSTGVGGGVKSVLADGERYSEAAVHRIKQNLRRLMRPRG